MSVGLASSERFRSRMRASVFWEKKKKKISPDISLILMAVAVKETCRDEINTDCTSFIPSL